MVAAIFVIFGRILPALNQDGDGMRDLLTGMAEDLLANHFGGHEALGLIGDMVGGEIGRAFGQAGNDGVAYPLQTFASERRDGDVFVEFTDRFKLLDVGEQLSLVLHPVDLIGQQQRGRGEVL